jgi:AraC-like DNA-binding protein
MQPNPLVVVRSTDALPNTERFQYWADVVTQTFVPLECDAPDQARFRGAFRHRQIGLIGITDVASSAMRVRRTPATIARSSSDDLIVVLHLRGPCHTGQRSAVAELVVGDGAMVAVDERYFFEFPDRFRQLVLKVPRHLLAEERIERDHQRSLLLASGPTRLLQKLALASLDDPLELSAEEELGIERAFVELLRSAMVPSSADDNVGDGSPHYSDASLFIRRHLADPALNPDAVALHVKMSTRNLARLFARRGATIERAIWTERLAAARRDLRDPRLSDRSITDVAFSWAFNDAAHFSRSFSKAYGLAPSEFRAKRRQPPPRRRG